MAQAGSGNGTGFPSVIDTRQTFVNSPAAAPDSATRLDAEVINDLLAIAVAVETTLGANPQGNFGSLAARLQQFLPGGGSTPLFFGFTNTDTLEIPGTTHNLGTAAPLFQAYDNATPRNSIEPAQMTCDTLTYAVTFTWQTLQSGAVSLAAPVPQYTTSFVDQTTLTIAGATHQLGSADLLVRVYTTSGTLNVLSNAPWTVATGTFDVVVSFATPQSGSVVLSHAGPRYAVSFTNQTTVTVLGSAHALGTPALLWQVYDAASPAHAIRPNTLTVDPSTYDVVMTFVTPQSGRLILVQASVITGSDFVIRDAGVEDSTATMMFSEDGTLNLQMGSGDVTRVLNKTGHLAAIWDADGNYQINGTATKPGGGPWLALSDGRLKRGVRPFQEGLATLQALMPVWFAYNGLAGIRPDGREHVGFVAQAVEAVAPYMIRRSLHQVRSSDPAPTEILLFDGEAMVPLLLNAVKTLAQSLETLEETVTLLWSTTDALARRVEALEHPDHPSMSEETSA